MKTINQKAEKAGVILLITAIATSIISLFMAFLFLSA